jgi:hypothetical protein
VSAPAPPVVVLVTFYSRSGRMETLALSLAVGAVQERALIRLRRVSDLDTRGAVTRYPEYRDALQRMHKEYVPPQEADILGADAIVVAAPADMSTSSPEWGDFLGMLRRLAQDGRLAHKVAAVVEIGAGPVGPRGAFVSTLFECGFVLVPPSAGPAEVTPQAATAHGRRVAAVARALKSVLPALT